MKKYFVLLPIIASCTGANRSNMYKQGGSIEESKDNQGKEYKHTLKRFIHYIIENTKDGTALHEFICNIDLYRQELIDKFCNPTLHIDDILYMVTSELVDDDTDLNAVAISSKTLLEFASEKGYTPIVKALLNKGAMINTSWHEEHGPLYYALKNGHYEVVKLLLAKGAAVEHKATLSSLHLASETGHVEMVKLLLDHNANVNCELGAV